MTNSESTLLEFKYHMVQDPTFLMTIIDLKKSMMQSPTSQWNAVVISVGEFCSKNITLGGLTDVVVLQYKCVENVLTNQRMRTAISLAMLSMVLNWRHSRDISKFKHFVFMLHNPGDWIEF